MAPHLRGARASDQGEELPCACSAPNLCGKLAQSAPFVGISLAESAPSGGVHHTRRAPTPAASLTDELDAFDTVLAQLVSDETPFSLDIIDMSAEVSVLLLQQAWRQWCQEPAAKSSQSLTRASRVCAAIASQRRRVGTHARVRTACMVHAEGLFANSSSSASYDSGPSARAPSEASLL